jgi:hypothetical protein
VVLLMLIRFRKQLKPTACEIAAPKKGAATRFSRN